MSHKVAEVRVGLKRVAINAITTEIIMMPTAGGPSLGATLDGTDWPITSTKEVDFNVGDRATLFWCTRGKRASDWAAGFNYRTGRLGVYSSGVYQLITPPFHNLTLAASIFVGIFSLIAAFGGSASAIVLVLLCLLPFANILWRHRKVVRAIKTALSGIRQQETHDPSAGAAGGVHI